MFSSTLSNNTEKKYYHTYLASQHTNESRLTRILDEDLTTAEGRWERK